MPKVTVLMCVYNGEKYLREAIESILNQTFRDFEFLIIDDGSTDLSRGIILSYNDPRIRIVVNETNIGLTKSLNKGLGLARGEYIARMDADDISMPERLGKQVSFMDKHPEVGVVGTWLKTFGGQNAIWRSKTDHAAIKCRLLFGSDIFHASVMMRTKSILDNGLRYDPTFLHCEDYELWMRVLEKIKVANIPEVLYLYRKYPEQTCRFGNEVQINNVKMARKKYIENLVGNVTESEILLHEKANSEMSNATKEQIIGVELWFLKLMRCNKNINMFSQRELKKILAQIFFSFCAANTSLGMWVWHHYYRSPLQKNAKVSIALQFKFLCKSIVRIKR